MLEEITIKDLAGIKSATLEFGPGLNCLTGESGAGKSIILSGLHLLMGRRSDASMVRHGAAQASAEGCWAVTTESLTQAVEDCGGEMDDGQLFINRTVKTDGKSRAVVGGKSTPTKTLSLLSEQLVSIHGQSDQLRLRTEEAQREALDKFGKSTIHSPTVAYSKTYREWRKIKAELKELREHADARRFEFEALKSFQTEFDALEPQENEIEELEHAIDKLSHLDSIREGVSEAMSVLNPDHDDAVSAESQLQSVVRVLNKLVQYDGELEAASKAAESALEAIGEATDSLEHYHASLDEDGLETLYTAQERLTELKKFVKKHHMNLSDLILKADTVSVRLEELDPEKHSIEDLEAEEIATLKDLTVKGEKLTKARKAAATKLTKAVNEELEGLAMGGTELVIGVESANHSPHGANEISFALIMPGSPTPKPIAKAASGGELSRIMLALEVVLADPEETPTFVFDEVDSGVGGATAIEIGRRLARLSEEAQVIVVTHLPQVACWANHHLKVTKSVRKGETVTAVATLEGEDRVKELTRMLSGLGDSEHGAAHARELLALAQAG